MGSFFIAAMVVAIVAIVFGTIFKIVKMSLQHRERIERIRHGYPLDDEKPVQAKPLDYVDMTGNGGRRDA